MAPDTTAIAVQKAAVLLSFEALLDVFITFSTHSITRNASCPSAILWMAGSIFSFVDAYQYQAAINPVASAMNEKMIESVFKWNS